MGRKRKTAVAVNGSAMADEVKTSNASPVTPFPGNKTLLDSVNPTEMEPTNALNNRPLFPNGSEATQNQPRVENKRVRRSSRLRGFMSPDWTRVVVEPIVDQVDLVENENENEEEETKETEKYNDLPLVENKNENEEEETEETEKVDDLPLVENENENEEVETEEPEKVDGLPVVNGNESGVTEQAEQGIPSPDLKDLSLDEKVNYLVRMVDEFKPKVCGKTNEGYKSLYIQTHKKYEALMEDHYEAIKSLEFARGQIAAYEKMKDAMGGPTREVILVEHQTSQNRVSSVVPHADHEIPKQKKATYNKKKKANN